MIQETKISNYCWFRSQYFIDLPVTKLQLYKIHIFTSTLLNFMKITYQQLLFKNFYILKDKDINYLREFYCHQTDWDISKRKIGPKDGDDFIKIMQEHWISRYIPQLAKMQKILIFYFSDIGNVWGVDYFDGDDEVGIRSSLNWYWLEHHWSFKFYFSNCIK